MDLDSIRRQRPDFILSGHSHEKQVWQEGAIRRINPGALHRSQEYTAAILDLQSDQVEFITVD